MRGRLMGDTVTEFHGWRGLGFLECRSGNPRAAVQMYTHAIECGRKVLGPVALLVLHGDRIWAALHADEDKGNVKNMTEELLETTDEVPSFMACHTLLIRAAQLCKAVGIVSAEAKCRKAASRCLLR